MILANPLPNDTIVRVKEQIAEGIAYQQLNLGGGVQSGCLWLMNLAGLIKPRAEFAIFADTGYERKGTYEYMDYLDEQSDKAGFPRPLRVFVSNIRSDMIGERKHVNMPVYTETGRKGGGMLNRQCTGFYKIGLIKRETRKIFGMRPRFAWIGFSLDEISRRNDDNFPKYIRPRYPLLEMRWSRTDCINWLKENGHPVPIKSSCIACPYRSDQDWLDMKENSPDEFRDAVDFDEKIRQRASQPNPKQKRQLSLFEEGKEVPAPSYDIFVHDSIQPLQIVRFNKKGKGNREQEECKGGCFL